MSNPLERIEAKLDHLIERVSVIDTTMAVNTNSLVEHVKRTNLLQEKEELNTKFRLMSFGVVKFLGLLAVVGGLIEAYVSIAGK